MSKPISELVAKIEGMTPPDRLRLAASLLEEKRPGLAAVIVEMVHNELSVVLLLAERAAARKAVGK